jgi:DNA-binding FadR family transcriptional regulator
MHDAEPAEPLPACRVLADRTLADEIRLGDQLPPEVTLAAQFGVHRSTVREGIRLLEETRMLRRKSPKRLVVAVPDVTHLSGEQWVARQPVRFASHDTAPLGRAPALDEHRGARFHGEGRTR